MCIHASINTKGQLRNCNHYDYVQLQLVYGSKYCKLHAYYDWDRGESKRKCVLSYELEDTLIIANYVTTIFVL